MALVQNRTLTLAHVGDSRAVLGIKRGIKYISKRITTDHKPNLPKEK